MRILGSYYDEHLADSGWSEIVKRDGRTYCLPTAVTGNSVTSLDVTEPTNIIKLSQVVDNINLKGSEYIKAISNEFAVNTALYSNAVNTIRIENLRGITVGKTLSHELLTGVAGADLAYDLTGYSVVMFGCCYYNKFTPEVGYPSRVTAVDYSNPLNPVIIGTVQDERLLGVVTCVYRDGYLLCACRGSDSIVSIRVLNPRQMEIVNVLKDESGQGRFGHLGGLIADGDNVYAPCGSSNTLSIVDRANTVSPFIVGSVTNNETLDRPLVPAVIRPNKLLASSVYDEDGVVLINIEDRTRPVITKYLVNEPYMDGADDLQWDEEDKRLYVTCCRSRRLAILDLELENTTTSSSSSTSSTETTSSTESTSSRTETTTTEKKGGRKKGHENPKNPHYGKDRRVK